MREIKFRAWDGKRMQYWDSLACASISVPELFISLEFGSLMQYTGLKDKNGKEIYEGDIVKTINDYETYGMQAGEINEVYFAFGGFRLKPKYRKGAKGFWLEDGNDVEIIGNIYENSELLKEKERAGE